MNGDMRRVLAHPKEQSRLDGVQPVQAEKIEAGVPDETIAALLGQVVTERQPGLPPPTMTVSVRSFMLALRAWLRTSGRLESAYEAENC